jgi:hypothetical protein
MSNAPTSRNYKRLKISIIYYFTNNCCILFFINTSNIFEKKDN